MVGYPNVLGILTPKHIHLLPAVFFQFHLKERWGMDVQTRGDISRTVEDRG